MILTRDKPNIKLLASNPLSNKVAINLIVIGPCMKNWISRHVGGTKIITSQTEFKLSHKRLTQISSAVGLSNALYSIYVLERDTIGFFLAL
jgi:hypothetical protein